MKAKIQEVKPEEIAVFFEKLQILIADETSFPSKAVEYFQSSWSIESLVEAAHGKKHVLLAAWAGGKIIGVVLGVPPEGGVGTIIWVLVEGAVQGQRIGSQLFQAACTKYRKIGCHKIKLTVPDENTVKFYEKQAMTVEGIHKNHWWGVDMWSMGKILI